MAQRPKGCWGIDPRGQVNRLWLPVHHLYQQDVEEVYFSSLGWTPGYVLLRPRLHPPKPEIPLSALQSPLGQYGKNKWGVPGSLGF